MAEPSPDSKPLRSAAVALLILAAAAVAVLWILGVVAIYDTDYNPRARPGTLLLAGQTLVGLSGVLSLGASALSMAAFDRTAPRRPRRAALFLLLAVILGAVWLVLAQVAASS